MWASPGTAVLVGGSGPCELMYKRVSQERVHYRVAVILTCGASVTEAKKNDFPRGTILLLNR